ncbi:hypothetical protein [Aliikangiella sp. IMCC44359]|uniref:hypothetical protein n=1 Tax=Aliikangiella sp. IMCC44359 TaxID=3459125 RepID=UPI00403A9E3E
MSSTQIKSNKIKLLASASVIFLSSCAYSDYPGHPGHKTANEAYVPSFGTVISGFGDSYDGTYVYSVKYNNRGWQKEDFKFNVKISSYRNIVNDSNPHRPNIFPDADGFNKATGFAGGTFYRYWTAYDQDPENTGGSANFDTSHPLDADGDWIAPALVVAQKVPVQEVDSVDWDLQSSIKNASQLMKSLISNGGSLKNLNLSVNAIGFNDHKVSVEPFALGFDISGLGLNQITIKNQPATKSVMQAILNNTNNLEKVDLTLHFSNGMEFALPNNISVMFNHSVISKLAK